MSLVCMYGSGFLFRPCASHVVPFYYLVATLHPRTVLYAINVQQSICSLAMKQQRFRENVCAFRCFWSVTHVWFYCFVRLDVQRSKSMGSFHWEIAVVMTVVMIRCWIKA